MRNSYFQLVNCESGYGLRVYPALEAGEEIQVQEILDYLDGFGIEYDRNRLELFLMDVDSENEVCSIGKGQCPCYPESYHLDISADGMLVTVRFIPPTETGARLSYNDFLRDLRMRNIVYGIQTEEIQRHFQSGGIYCTDIILARGKEPVAGVDASIEYFFNTEEHRRPAVREDGSVDFFKLTTINQCRKGDALARIIPEVPGIDGSDVFGKSIKAKEPKHAILKFGRNISLSDDRRTIYSMVDGHVTLLEDKVFVSDVYAVKNVDVSTGNLEYEGSIQIEGNVAAGFEVKAGGNVIVDGLVESAKIVAGGKIIIGKGMNGSSEGILKAGGDVIVKFLENARVVTGGYVHTETILHSYVSAGTEVVVEGKRGLIVGGHIQAAQRIEARNIGASMGAQTILEVGVNPFIKEQYNRVEKAVAEVSRVLQNAETVAKTFREKQTQAQYTTSQLLYINNTVETVKQKTAELEQLKNRLEKLRRMMDIQKAAEVVVNNEMFPGTTIIIGDAARTIQTSYHYCKFIKEQGEVKMAAL